MKITINPTFTIAKSTDTTRDYGDSLANFQGIVTAFNNVFSVVDSSVYLTAQDGSVYSFATTKV